MPDITMCKNNNCPMKNDCYRYTAIPNAYQSYSLFEFDKKCDYFIKRIQDAGSNIIQPVKK
jgi:hypothetical protein